MTTRTRLAAAAAAGLAVGGLTGCAGGGEPTLTVLAAASLADTFPALAEEFEQAHGGAEVRLVFDSSATLADKAADRAPGDVLATADERTMEQAVEAGGTVGDPVQFATNVLVVAVPEENPAGIDDVDDLQDAGVDYLTCVPTAPCGAGAQALLESSGITHPPVSEETDVRAVLAKVVAGEADAGLVYRTDAHSAGDDVDQVAIPGAEARSNSYWLAVTPAADDPELAEEWISLVLSARGREILADAGFGPADRR